MGLQDRLPALLGADGGAAGGADAASGDDAAADGGRPMAIDDGRTRMTDGGREDDPGDGARDGAGTPPREAAESFAAAYPAFDLDFTRASLARVDALADEFEGAPDDVLDGLAAYVGETFVRAYGAGWTREDGPWVVAVPDDGEPATVTVGALAADAVEGDAAVVDVHDHVVDRLGLDGPTLASGEGGPGHDGSEGDAADEEGAGEGDPIDRFAAKAAAEVAAEDAGEPAPERAVERHRTAAESLAADWPAYALDFSVPSLVRLDALVAAEFDASGGDREYDGDPLDLPADARLAIPTDGAVEAFGGYLAELFRRHHDATWRADGEDLALVVEGPAGRAALDPDRVAIACFAGESSFVDAYARVAADVGLEPPLEA